jgi:NTP pyrophosphatase (non-canonical NTP hydrolase)
MMELLNKIRQWARDRNLINGSEPIRQYAKLVSEIGELGDAILANDQAEIIDALGDSVVVLTIIADQYGMKLEDCIESAYNVIKDRKGVMYNGSFVKESHPLYANMVAELQARSEL